jgi:hypothetical protein
MKKSIVLLAFCLTAHVGPVLLTTGCRPVEAQPPEPPKDLGVLSPVTLIPLRSQTTRPGVHIEVTAMSLLSGSARTQFTTTNDFLSVTNFASLPSGRTLLGLRAVSSEGIESDAKLYTFDLRKSDKIPAPEAGQVVLNVTGLENARSDSPLPSGPGEETGWLNVALDRLRAHNVAGRPPIPPLPPGWNPADYTNQAETNLVHTEVFIRFDTNAPPNRPLPGGKNETYFEGQDRAADNKKRRNE